MFFSTRGLILKSTIIVCCRLSFGMQHDPMDGTLVLTQGFNNILRIYEDQARVLLSEWTTIENVLVEAAVDRRACYSHMFPHQLIASVSELQPFLLLRKYYWDSNRFVISDKRTIQVQLDELVSLKRELVVKVVKD